MKNRRVVVRLHLMVGLVTVLGFCGCHVSEYGAVDISQQDRYYDIARLVIARDFPHINLEDGYGHTIWMDRHNRVHVMYSRNSDWQEYVGSYSYCHENFIKERVEVELRPSGEMVAVSVEKRHVSAECVERSGFDEEAKLKMIR